MICAGDICAVSGPRNNVPASGGSGYSRGVMATAGQPEFRVTLLKPVNELTVQGGHSWQMFLLPGT
ncbi:hypothetical protein OHD60_09770 [Escherichia coli]|nr:hypothetical protein [Escherichia coli]